MKNYHYVPHTLKSEWISLCITLEWRVAPLQPRTDFTFNSRPLTLLHHAQNPGSTRFDRALINTTGPDSAGYMHYLWWFGHGEASSILPWLWNMVLWSLTSPLSLFFWWSIKFLSVSDLNFKILLTLKNVSAPMFDFLFYYTYVERCVFLISKLTCWRRNLKLKV